MTGVLSGPVLTTSVMLSPFFSGSPASGSVRITHSAVTLSLLSSTVSMVRSRSFFRFFSATFAACTVWPVRSSILSVFSPALTVTLITRSLFFVMPFTGSWAMMVPSGASS